MNHQPGLPEATLLFLIRGDPPAEILLGYKKTGFGQGKWGGIGGKVESGEPVERAAAREMEEETGVQVPLRELQRFGRLVFLFPSRPAWSQLVYVFLAHAWQGDPRETREIKPAWVRVAQIPYEGMWQDANYWLPPLLAGKRVQACFTFSDDNESVERVEFGAL